MELLLQGGLALLAALGLSLLGGLAVLRFLRPAQGDGAWLLVPGRRDGDRLELALRSLQWLRELGLLRCSIAVADVDLTREGRELALRLAARWPEVVLWPADRLEELIGREQIDT